MRMLGAATATSLAAVAAAAGVFGCGGAVQTGGARKAGQDRAHAAAKGFNASPAIAGVRQVQVGAGTQAAMVLTHAGAPIRDPAPVVVFLHAWGPTGTLLYTSWLRHLASEGVMVIFPVYQDRASHPASAPTNVQAGVRAALALMHNTSSSVVLVGYTTGAALALDYAASAKSAGLPPACGVYGVFPAVSFGLHTAVPLSNPARLPAAMRLVLVAGSSDPVPGGEALARAIAAQARQIPSSRKEFRRSPGDDPNGPLLATRQARSVYWLPFDRMIRRCSGPR